MCWKLITLTPDQKRLSAIIVRQILYTIKDQQPTYFGIFVLDIRLSLLPVRKAAQAWADAVSKRHLLLHVLLIYT